jgi:hypothetical protein
MLAIGFNGMRSYSNECVWAGPLRAPSPRTYRVPRGMDTRDAARSITRFESHRRRDHEGDRPLMRASRRRRSDAATPCVQLDVSR